MEQERVEEQQPELQLPVETDGTWKNPGDSVDEFLERQYEGDIGNEIDQKEAIRIQEEKNAALLEAQQGRDQGFLPDNPLELAKETAMEIKYAHKHP